MVEMRLTMILAQKIEEMGEISEFYLEMMVIQEMEMDVLQHVKLKLALLEYLLLLLNLINDMKFEEMD